MSHFCFIHHHHFVLFFYSFIGRMFSTTKKIGILGGGQLGKMLCIAAAPLDLKISILEKNADCPAAPYCAEMIEGDITDYEAVLAFGQDKEWISIEIEHVNTEALHALEALGKHVYPSPAVLDVIKDKGLQKQFYKENGIPTAPFSLFESEIAVQEAVKTGQLLFPFVQKTRTAGYDGKGVAVIKNELDLSTKLLLGPCVVEELADIQSEIAVMVARNAGGELSVFPAVEMEFHPEANLVEKLICPARLDVLSIARAEALAEQVMMAFDTCGLLAVELFLNKDGSIWVNEVAPRPHNSGHHTIDSAVTSQFQQHLRAICNLPLGDTAQVRPAVMLNVLGEPGFSGPVRYEGMEELLKESGVYVHLYGKSTTSPFRKMGHITVTDATIEEAIQKAEKLKNKLRVIS
jgi:5-(carboxyamino)imidazole ribonucleotide synthase